MALLEINKIDILGVGEVLANSMKSVHGDMSAKHA